MEMDVKILRAASCRPWVSRPIARSSQRGLHRPRGGLRGPHRKTGQGPRHQGQERPLPLGGFRPCHCQWPRRRLHQVAVRRQPGGWISKRPCMLAGATARFRAAASMAPTPTTRSARSLWPFRWAPMRWTSAKPSTPTPTLTDGIGMAAKEVHGI